MSFFVFWEGIEGGLWQWRVERVFQIYQRVR